MKERTEIVRRPSAWPILTAALAWSAGCLFLSMIRLSDYLICTALALGAWLLAKKAFPQEQVMVQIPLSPLEQARSEQLEQAQEALAALNRAVAKIDDPQLTQNLEMIRSVSGQIVGEMEIRPQISEQARKLVDYYLPILTRMIETYNDLEEDPLQTSSITQSRKKIRETVSMCAEAFVKQWDVLHEHQAMELNADSDVLETLLVQQGLWDRRKENEK